LSDLDLLRLQNRIRGHISAARDKSAGGRPAPYTTRKGLKLALADARKLLDPPAYAELFAWTNQQIRSQLRFLPRSPFVYREFGVLPRQSARLLKFELQFAALHLRYAAQAVKAQLRFHRLFEAALWAGHNEILEKLLVEIEKNCGQSLWLIEATIATKQHVSGLEAQKRFAQHVSGLAKRLQAEYYAYYLSVRNEPNVTPSRFAEDYERHLKKTRFSPPVRIYLLYKITGLLPTNIDRLADLLLVEHGSADIDLYETFLAVSQEIVASDPSSEMAELVFAIVESLVHIEDFRLDQLLLFANKSRPSPAMKLVPSLSTDNLLMGNVKEALKQCCNQLKTESVNTNELITAGVALAASAEANRTSKSKRLLDQQVRNISALLRMGSEYERAQSELQKLGSGWAFVPSVKAFIAFAHAQSPGNGAVLWRYKRVLNSAANDPRSTLGIFEVVSTGRAKGAPIWPEYQGATSEFIAAISNKERPVSDSFNIQLKTAIELLRKIDGPSANWSALWAEILAQKLTAFLENHCAIQFVQRLLLVGEYGLAADVLVDLALLKGISLTVLPLRELASGDSWRRLRQFSAAISIPIVIDLIWRVTGDDKDATAKRFAVQKFLSSHSITVPSQVTQIQTQITQQRIFYFLSSVCAPTVLDMLPMLSNSQMVEDERVNICRVLSEIDPANSDKYQDEILLSEHQRVVRSGLRVVDSSRIHVDEDALIIWAARELGETFRRYSDLVKAGVGVADNYDALLKGLLKSDELNKAYYEIPRSEADDILFEMVSELADRFINNSDFGLDSYLSKRVRHESLTSYLRNPLERQGLITQIDSKTGKYETNNDWGAASARYSDEVGQKIDDWLREFSESFDKILVSLRSDYFHIRSKDKPLGLFDFSLTAPMLHLLRSIVQQRLEVEDFARACLTLFWVSLHSSLTRARDCLRIDTKTKIADLFEQLRAKIYTLVLTPAVAELSAAVGNTSATVQAEIDNVAEWFVRQEVRQGTYRYTLKQAVDIAIESALRGMRNFEPDIHITNTGEGLIVGSELIVIADIMRVALGNVKAHSNKARSRPRVEIDVVENFEEEIISFKVESEIGSGVRCDENQKRLDEIRADIDAKTYSGKVRLEGGSGLRKLASIVHQSDRGRIDFRFASDDKFVLEIDISFFVAEPIEVAA
jgi:hypothetical protein